MEALFYKSNPWWEEPYSFKGIHRNKYLISLEQYLANNDIIFLTGLRRVGKTTLLKAMIDLLLRKKKIEAKTVFYISLDMYALDGMSIEEIVTEFRKLQKLSTSEMIYLFLDEITSKANYHQQLKNLYDLGQVKIYASSSSASLLKDSKSFLTGRQRLMEVMPLDFHEYLLFKNITLKKSDPHLLDGYFEDYMKDGGMPEYVLSGDISYLSNLIDNIVYKDVIAHYRVKDEQIVKDFFRLLMERAGKQLSLNKMAKILGIGVDTARRYQSYFEDTFLIYSIEKFGKLNERIKNPKKIYAGDIGIRNIITGFRDKGAIFENLVFLEIKNRNPHYIYENGIEIDFIIDNNRLIEAKYHSSLNPRQKKLFDGYQCEYKMLVDSPKEFFKLLKI